MGAGARPAAGTPAADSRSSVDSYGSSAQGGGAAGAVASTDHAARVLSPSLEVAATAMAGSGSSPSSTPVVLATTASRLASAFMEDVARTRELLTTLQKERVEEDYYEAKVAELLATPGGAGSTSGPRRVPAAAAGSASAVKKAERRAEKLAGNVKKRAEHGRTAVRLRDQAVAAIGRLLAARDPLLDRLLSSFVAAQAARLRDPSYGVMSETVRGRWPHLLSLPPGDGGLAALRQQHFTIHGAGGGGVGARQQTGAGVGDAQRPPTPPLLPTRRPCQASQRPCLSPPLPLILVRWRSRRRSLCGRPQLSGRPRRHRRQSRRRRVHPWWGLPRSAPPALLRTPTPCRLCGRRPPGRCSPTRHPPASPPLLPLSRSTSPG